MSTYIIRFSLFVYMILIHLSGISQVQLNADGPGNTYGLINSVLAPGYNAIEVPDCGHNSFGEHIDEVFDSELNVNVFRFIIHVSPDDDRCINFDRQRNEIKTYDKSPDNLLGVENETVRYEWKFKLPVGFQTSPNFSHIHQLKSVGDQFDHMPMYTLTARKGNPDRLELRYAETGTQTTLSQTDLAPFLGTWVSVTETIEYRNPGAYSIEIRKVADSSVVFSYSNSSIMNWRVGADFLRPKWGIYRSLINAQDLRDEEILYAGFSIEELFPVSIEESGAIGEEVLLFPNPVGEALQLQNLPTGVYSVQLLSSDGRILLERETGAVSGLKLDVSSFANGLYFLRLIGGDIHSTHLVSKKN